MTGPRGVVAAAAIALIVTGAHAAFRAWPAAHGVEVLVPATLERQAAAPGYARVRLRCDRIALDVAHGPPAVTETYEPMRRIGGWWVSGGDAHANMRRLRGHRLYLQLIGEAANVHAATVSDAPVPGAVNLAGTVTDVREDGYLRMDFSFAPIAIPATVRDGPATAVLSVLPSGRATLSGVVASDGVRY